MDVTCTNNPNKVIKIDEIIITVPIFPIHTIGAIEKENIPSIAYANSLEKFHLELPAARCTLWNSIHFVSNPTKENNPGIL